MDQVSKTTRPNCTVFVVMLPVAVTRSASDGVAIRYDALPVLLMASCFHIIVLSDS